MQKRRMYAWWEEDQQQQRVVRMRDAQKAEEFGPGASAIPVSKLSIAVPTTGRVS